MTLFPPSCQKKKQQPGVVSTSVTGRARLSDALILILDIGADPGRNKEIRYW